MVIQSEWEGPPLDPQALEQALRPFGQSRMLPREAYTSQSVFDWERRHFFEGTWMCVAAAEHLPEPEAPAAPAAPTATVSRPLGASQRAESTGAGSVLLTRDGEGRVRAFANTCRHRGHELLACGQASASPVVRCPYHSWTYHLDGTLNRAPGYSHGGLDGFDTADNGLFELPAAEWNGLVFVHAAPTDPTPFEEHVGGLDELFAPWEMGRLRIGGQHDYTVAANWKVLSENYQECYHCPSIHPELCRVSPPDSGLNYDHPSAGAWVGGWQDLRPDAATMSLDGTSPVPPLRGLDEDFRRRILYVGIFPNVLVSLHPDYVMTHVLIPMGPASTRVRCSWAFDPDELGRKSFNPSFAMDFWDVTNKEDWRACESVQRGLSNEMARPGVLSGAEDAVYQYVTLVARGYAGLPLTTGAVAAG